MCGGGFFLFLQGGVKMRKAKKQLQQKLPACAADGGKLRKFLSLAVGGIPGATLGIVSFHVFYMSLRIAGGDGCPAPVDFLRKLLMRSVFLRAFSKTCKHQQSWEESRQTDGERLIAEYEYALTVGARRGLVTVRRKANALESLCFLQPQNLCVRLWGLNSENMGDSGRGGKKMGLCKGGANVPHLPDAHFIPSSPKPPTTTSSCRHCC